MNGNSKDGRPTQSDRLVEIATNIDVDEAESARTEALVNARAVALTGLPLRKTSAQSLSRTLRLGQNLWLKVIYSTSPDGVLPYGADRFVLAGIQHFALKQGSRIVLFEQVGQLLDYFGLDKGGNSFKRLRDRFERIAGLAIYLRFSETKAGLKKPNAGEQAFVIDKYVLPTREEARCARIGQYSLPRLYEKESEPVQYGVVLSEYFWKHLREKKNQLLLHLEVMKQFIDKPTGWDYACYLTDRCLRARRWSIVPHETLMSLFKDNPNESDNQAIRRLQNYHSSIMTATGRRLKAILEQNGYFPRSPKGGHRKARWQLRVGPSENIIWSGKKSE